MGNLQQKQRNISQLNIKFDNDSLTRQESSSLIKYLERQMQNTIQKTIAVITGNEDAEVYDVIDYINIPMKDCTVEKTEIQDWALTAQKNTLSEKGSIGNEINVNFVYNNLDFYKTSLFHLLKKGIEAYPSKFTQNTLSYITQLSNYNKKQQCKSPTNDEKNKSIQQLIQNGVKKIVKPQPVINSESSNRLIQDNKQDSHLEKIVVEQIQLGDMIEKNSQLNTD
ncbi:hypothetical protein ABPG74_010926 [Tetrahymena malaccensis]